MHFTRTSRLEIKAEFGLQPKWSDKLVPHLWD